MKRLFLKMLNSQVELISSVQHLRRMPGFTGPSLGRVLTLQWLCSRVPTLLGQNLKKSQNSVRHALKEGSFRASTFHDNCDFAFANFASDDNTSKILTASTSVLAVADFVGVTVVEPAELSLYRVNEHSRQGLLAALTNSTIERFRFEDVHWCHRHGRIVLHDELEESWASTSDYTGLVAITYRKLIDNFEAVRAYELA